MRYLLGPGRANEHTDERVIAVSTGIEVTHGTTLDPAERRALVAQLDAPRAIFGTEVKGGHVWHLSLTNPVGDRSMSDDEWADAVRVVMDRLGFEDLAGARAPAPWVAIRHGESTAGNEHVHVAVPLVREDGTRASIWQDRNKLSQVCGELEHRYGLTVVEGRSAGSTPEPERAVIERAEREGKPEPDRTRLSRAVRGAAAASSDEAEFVARLRASGVRVRPRYATGSRSEVLGYSVALDAEQPVWFGGGRLAKDLALPALRAGWNPVEDQAAAWNTSTRQAGRESSPIDPAAWEQAAQRVRAVTERLGQVDLGDDRAWSQAARDAAGVMAALAERFEADRPGPLSQAADTLARSAQRTDHRAHHRLSTLGGVATVAAQATMRGRAGGMAGTMLVVAELARLTEALQRAHQVRAELVRAEALHRQMQQALAHPPEPPATARPAIGPPEKQAAGRLSDRGHSR